MQTLTPLAKGMIAIIGVGTVFAATHTYGPNSKRAREESELVIEPKVRARAEALTPSAAQTPQSRAGLALDGKPAQQGASATAAVSAKGSALPAPYTSLDGRPVRVGLSQWPGHLALVVGAGGLTTQPGSVAAAAGLQLEIKFLEDAASKNKALATGEVDFVWTTVDEMPINLGTFVEAQVPVRAFLQIDWSRGGDACVAAPDVRTVEDILGRKSAMLMFSPDHTVFEFMISNSRLTPAQTAEVRNATQFSLDDFTFGRKLFARGEVDVACLWEPDVTLALAERKGAHRLFSTADATELVADVLIARKDTLDARPDIAQKLAQVWFSSVQFAEADRARAARVITDSCS